MQGKDYTAGQRKTWLTVLNLALRQLELLSDDGDLHVARWVSEREETLTVLRRLCEEHGDMEWHEPYHLADILADHLEPYLEEGLLREDSVEHA